MTTVAMVPTRTRSGWRTSEARPRSRTAPPIMMMGGRMASQRMGGTVMEFDAVCGGGVRRGEQGRDHLIPSTPWTATGGWTGRCVDSTWAMSWLTDGLMRSSTGLG